MDCLSFVQSEAATKLDQTKRLEWIQRGMYVLKHAGKRGWQAAIKDREIEEAKSFLATGSEGADFTDS